MGEFLKYVSFFFLLFNPFLMSIYLVDLIRSQSPKQFYRVLIRASIISSLVFIVVALVGESLFSDVLFVRFESFQIFGGLLFVLIGIRFVFSGAESIATLRGNAEHVAGSIAMPFMIGPGTISAAIIIGNKLPPLQSTGAIILTLFLTVHSVLFLKLIHDRIKKSHTSLIERYVEIVGRLSALYIGTVAVEMIINGVMSLKEGGIFPS